MHSSNAGSQGGTGPSIGWKSAVGILIASVAAFVLIVLLFGVSWYAWGFLGLVIVGFGIFSAARFGIHRAGGAEEPHPS
jgi:hypothetical protein